MPDRAGSTRPDGADPPPRLRLTGGAPAHDHVASQRSQRRWIRPWSLAREPGEPYRRGFGDLVEGGLAVVALLVMVAIGVTPWLAIPLSVVTYIAVALLRPARGRQAETTDGTVTDDPVLEAAAEDSDHGQLPDTVLTGIDTVAIRFGLTRREREILPLLAHRLTDREIAEQLTISHRTAMNHTANILGKLGLASRRDVATFVARHALPPSSAPPHAPE